MSVMSIRRYLSHLESGSSTCNRSRHTLPAPRSVAHSRIKSYKEPRIPSHMAGYGLNEKDLWFPWEGKTFSFRRRCVLADPVSHAQFYLAYLSHELKSVRSVNLTPVDHKLTEVAWCFHRHDAVFKQRKFLIIRCEENNVILEMNETSLCVEFAV